MSIGQTIGVVEHSFKVTNNAGGEVQLRVKFDFRTTTDTDIKSWLCGNRVITLQRPIRSLSESELKKLDGTTVNASTCGQKVKSREEQIAAIEVVFVNAGLEPAKAHELAIAGVEHPDLLRVDEVEVEDDDETETK